MLQTQLDDDVAAERCSSDKAGTHDSNHAAAPSVRGAGESMKTEGSRGGKDIGAALNNNATSGHEELSDSDETISSLEFRYGVVDCGEVPVFADDWTARYRSWLGSSGDFSPFTSETDLRSPECGIHAQAVQESADERMHTSRNAGGGSLGALCGGGSSTKLGGSCTDVIQWPRDGRRSAAVGAQNETKEEARRVKPLSTSSPPVRSVKLEGEAVRVEDMTYQPVLGSTTLSRSPLASSGQFCEACRQLIVDRDMMTDGESAFWHNRCLRCCRCNSILPENAKCYRVEGRVYCEVDYHTNRPVANSTPCWKCDKVLLQGERVQEVLYNRTWVFMHQQCFYCDYCRGTMVSGMGYIFYQGWMVCDQHFELHGDTYQMHEGVKNFLEQMAGTQQQQQQPSQPSPFEHTPSYVFPPSGMDAVGGSEAGHEGGWIPPASAHAMEDMYQRSLGINPPQSPYPTAFSSTHMAPFPVTPQSDYRFHPQYIQLQSPHWGHHSDSMSHAVQPKKRRSRTSFTDEQHRILTERFEDDPNPDSSDLERIGQECGLKKRTVQIWFQNTRARTKKMRTEPPPSQTTQSTKTMQATSKSAKTSTVFTSSSPATTPSTISTTESLSSDFCAQPSDTTHTTSHAVAAAATTTITESTMLLASRSSSSVSGRPEAERWQRSPLQGSMTSSLPPVTSSLESMTSSLHVPDWKPPAQSSGFESLDYFSNPPFIPEDFGLVDESSEGRTP